MSLLCVPKQRQEFVGHIIFDGQNCWKRCQQSAQRILSWMSALPNVCCKGVLGACSQRCPLQAVRGEPAAQGGCQGKKQSRRHKPHPTSYASVSFIGWRLHLSGCCHTESYRISICGTAVMVDTESRAAHAMLHVPTFSLQQQKSFRHIYAGVNVKQAMTKIAHTAHDQTKHNA